MKNFMKEHYETFGVEKPLIGCVHLPALPGTPHYDKTVSFKDLVARAKKEALDLEKAGFDAVIFANEGDRPYEFEVGPEIIASYVRIVSEAISAISIPYGCGVLIDPIATLAIAKAIDAKFVRTYITGTYADMFGFHQFRPSEVYRYIHRINAENVKIYGYFDAHAGTALDNRSQLQQIDTALPLLEPAGVLVPGQRAGTAPSFSEVKEIKETYPDNPILIASGVNEKNVKEALEICDGAVIGTCLKVDGILWNPIDFSRAENFIQATKK